MLPRTGAALRAQARAKEREKEPEPVMVQPRYVPNHGGPTIIQNPTGSPVYRAPPGGFRPRLDLSATNRGAPRDRYANVISEKEAQEMILQREDRGNKFRFLVLVVLGVIVALLFSMKYDIEYNTEVPLLIAPNGMVVEDTPLNRARIEEERQARANMAASDAGTKGKTNEDGVGTVSQRELQEQLAAMGVNFDQAKKDFAAEAAKDAAEAAAAAAAKPADPNATVAVPTPKAELTPEEQELRQRRLDLRRATDAAKKAMEEAEEKLSTDVVVCGRECKNQHEQRQRAHMAISTTVVRDLFAVLDLVDEKEAAKAGGRIQAPKHIDEKKLKENFDKKKEAIETSEEDPEYKKMALAELKEAYINVADPELRRYYMMYGRLAPPMMRKVSARDGGAGQDLALRTFKNKLILAWLAHFDSEWADISVLCFLGFVGFLLPALIQLPKIIAMAQEIEKRQDEMDELERRAAAAEAH